MEVHLFRQDMPSPLEVYLRVDSAGGGAERGQADADLVGTARGRQILQEALVGGHRFRLAAGQLERARLVHERVLEEEAARVEVLDQGAVGLGRPREVALGLPGPAE